MHYDVGGCVICISNKVEYQFCQRSYVVILTCPCNAIKKCWTKFRFRNTLLFGKKEIFNVFSYKIAVAFEFFQSNVFVKKHDLFISNKIIASIALMRVCPKAIVLITKPRLDA